MLGGIMTLSNRKMHRAVAAELGEFSSLLEIGFGSGAQLEMISKMYTGKELYGIELSQDMLEVAGNRLGTSVKLSLGDCSETFFPDGFFDVVITTDTCYFWSDPQKVLREIDRITKPKSRLILAYNAVYAGSVHRSAGGSMCDDKTIKEETRHAGMKVISQKKCGFKQEIYVIETN